MNILKDAQEMSARISEAVGIITPYNLHIAVFVLESYVGTLKRDANFSPYAYVLLKNVLRSTAAVTDAKDPTAEKIHKEIIEEALRRARGEDK